MLLCAQTAGNALRFFVYDVLYEGRLIRDPSYAPALSRSRRSLGVAAAFIVSGLMHEHMYMFAPRECHTILPYGLCRARLEAWHCVIVSSLCLPHISHTNSASENRNCLCL